jgi:hypothetical protein
MVRIEYRDELADKQVQPGAPAEILAVIDAPHFFVGLVHHRRLAGIDGGSRPHHQRNRGEWRDQFHRPPPLRKQ